MNSSRSYPRIESIRDSDKEEGTTGGGRSEGGRTRSRTPFRTGSVKSFTDEGRQDGRQSVRS